MQEFETAKGSADNQQVDPCVGDRHANGPEWICLMKKNKNGKSVDGILFHYACNHQLKRVRAAIRGMLCFFISGQVSQEGTKDEALRSPRLHHVCLNKV